MKNSIRLLALSIISIQALSGCMMIRAVDQAILDQITNCNSTALEGSGSEGDPYKICSRAQLEAIAGESNSYVLGRDLDLSDSEFTPIDDFQGKLNGNGHTISNLHFSDPQKSSVGLFGNINANNVDISNLVLDSPRIEGYKEVGSLIGTLSDSGSATIINNITVINPIISAKGSVGGLIGSGDHAEISNIKISKLRIIGDTVVGGLVGRTTDQFEVSDVQLDGEINAGIIVGGMAGLFYSGSVYRTAVMVNITADQDTFQVSDEGENQGAIGGIIGYADTSTITDSYFLGSILVTSDYVNAVGGMAGKANDTQITTSYVSSHNITDLQGNGDDVYGFVGNDYGNGIYDYSYYYSHAYVPGSTNTPDVDGMPSTADLASQTKFFGFDFNNVWQISTSTHRSPSLKKFQQASAPFEEMKYRPNSRGSVFIEEVEDATGYLFADTKSDEFEYVYLTLTNKTGSSIFLKDAYTALSNSFLLATGAWTGCTFVSSFVTLSPSLGALIAPCVRTCAASPGMIAAKERVVCTTALCCCCKSHPAAGVRSSTPLGPMSIMPPTVELMSTSTRRPPFKRISRNGAWPSI